MASERHPNDTRRSFDRTTLSVSLIALVVLLFLIYCAPRWIEEARFWLVHRAINSHELAVRSGTENNEQLIVQDEDGSLYRLGNGRYDSAIRKMGAGCRVYTRSGEPMDLRRFKPTDNIPMDAIPAGSYLEGSCRAPGFDPKRSQD
jgi:hypothetical protein